MRRRFRMVWALAALAAALVAAATVAAARSAEVAKIAVAAPEKANDYGWNQQGVRATRATAAYYKLKLEVADGIGYDNVEPVLRQLAQNGADLIVAQASGYNTIAPRIAAQFKTHVLTYDNPKATKTGQVADIETSSQQGSYLAGVLAGSMTKTGELGIVLSAADTNWFKMAGGFIAGARSVNKGVTFNIAQIGQAGYADAAGGKRVTQSVIDAGSDIVFGMGDGSSFGMIQAVETAKKQNKVWFIDVIGNKKPIDKRNVLLSSVIWDFTPIFKQAVRDIRTGRFGSSGYDLNLTNGISLLRTKAIAPSAWAKVVAARKAVISGSVKVPLTGNKAAMDKLAK